MLKEKFKLLRNYVFKTNNSIKSNKIKSLLKDIPLQCTRNIGCNILVNLPISNNIEIKYLKI